MAYPRISIVTPTLNTAEHIAEAIESVLVQGYPKIEHIVVDGGSTDGTLQALVRYPHLRVISAADRGVYDALNKGIALASGEVIGWLNGDDVYEPGAFAAVAEAFTADSNLDAVCGGAVVVNDAKIVRDCRDARSRELSFACALLGSPVINARFFRRRLYERVGPYDLSYPLTADRDFLVRIILAGCRWRDCDRLLYRYRMHEGSLTHNFATATAWRLSEEYLLMAERRLVASESPPELRRVCRQLYGESALRLAWLAWRKRELRRAVSALLLYQGRLSWRPVVCAVQALGERASRIGRRNY